MAQAGCDFLAHANEPGLEDRPAARRPKTRSASPPLVAPRALQPRRGMPPHTPAELAVDDLADRFEQPLSLLRRHRRVIRERRKRIQIALAVEVVRLREE